MKKISFPQTFNQYSGHSPALVFDWMIQESVLNLHVLIKLNGSNEFDWAIVEAFDQIPESIFK